MAITFIILIIAIVLFVSDRLRPDLVALLVMLALGLSGVLSAAETFSGFSRSAVITIIGIFVLAEGLRRTGITEKLGEALVQLGGKREAPLVLAVTVAGALLSLFMNNIAAVSVLMPAVSGAARKTGVSPSRLLMPLAFGTILGGMATLLTTTNILVSGILREHGLTGFSLLDFGPVGLPIVMSGTLYMTLIGRRLLPVQAHPELLSPPSREDDLEGVYRLDERIIRGRVFSESSLVGKSVQQSQLREKYKLNLVAIQRGSRMMRTISPEMNLDAGDILYMIGRLDLVPIAELGNLVEAYTLPIGNLGQMPLVEVVLTPRSALVGKTLREVHFREKFGMNVVAIWRAGQPFRTGHADLPLQFGDALLLQGPPERIPVLQSEPELLVMASRMPQINKRKALLATLVMLATLAATAFSPFPTGEVMLSGALVMVLIGVLDMDQAYRAIDWKSVFLIAGMLPLGTALSKTGAAALLGTALVSSLGKDGTLPLMAGLVALSILLTQVMNGAAVAAIMAPLGILVAEKMGIDARGMAMGVALATSVAFITPLGHPVNVLVMGPGGYKFRDFARVGIFLTLIVFAIIMLFLPRFWLSAP